MGKKKKQDVRNLIIKLASEEEEFVSQPFFAPAVAGGKVRVKIGNTPCSFSVGPSDFEGYGIFEPLSYTEAVLDREATLAERQRYLELFPVVRLIATRQVGSCWLAIPASDGDNRFQIEGVIPILLTRDVRGFDVVVTRYDGNAFWFEQVDSRYNPRHADYLRKAFAEEVLAEDLEFSGLSKEHRDAYDLAFSLQNAEQDAEVKKMNAKRDHAEAGEESGSDVARIRRNVAHGGGRLIEYVDLDDIFRVTFTVNGQSFTSAVEKGTLSLVSSGICLNGRDRDFDLASLVGVLRIGMKRGEL